MTDKTHECAARRRDWAKRERGREIGACRNGSVTVTYILHVLGELIEQMVNDFRGEDAHAHGLGEVTCVWGHLHVERKDHGVTDAGAQQEHIEKQIHNLRPEPQNEYDAHDSNI
jgi:hypothetical protein